MIETAINFVANLTPIEFIGYFWPFFILDIIRYVLIELVVLIIYKIKQVTKKTFYGLKRRELFQERPLVSVIVPGKNEGKYIPKLIETLSKQTYKNIEIIVVDDGSDDNTPFICRALEKKGLINSFIRNEVRGGKASAANTALQFSNGKYIIHLDADSHLSNNAIEKILLPFYMNEKVGGVGGDVRVNNTAESMTTSLQGIEYLKSILTSRTVSSELGILRIISGAHGAFRKDVLAQIGGWDVGPGLDGDITLKIRKLGYDVVHEPQAICYTNVPNTLKKLGKQRYRWDKSMVRFRLRKHLDILKPGSSFRFSNFVSVFENLFFNLFLDIKWFIYIAQILVFNSEYIVILLLINYILYFLSNCIQYLLVLWMLEKPIRKQEFKLIMYIPLIPLYTGLFLRFIRTFSYLMEFFHKRSYIDKWNPWKVSRIAEDKGL